jgi:hypothetical protein
VSLACKALIIEETHLDRGTTTATPHDFFRGQLIGCCHCSAPLNSTQCGLRWYTGSPAVTTVPPRLSAPCLIRSHTGPVAAHILLLSRPQHPDQHPCCMRCRLRYRPAAGVPAPRSHPLQLAQPATRLAVTVGSSSSSSSGGSSSSSSSPRRVRTVSPPPRQPHRHAQAAHSPPAGHARGQPSMATGSARRQRHQHHQLQRPVLMMPQQQRWLTPATTQLAAQQLWGRAAAPCPSAQRTAATWAPEPTLLAQPLQQRRARGASSGGAGAAIQAASASSSATPARPRLLLQHQAPPAMVWPRGTALVSLAAAPPARRR